jgi:hypothetical protein
MRLVQKLFCNLSVCTFFRNGLGGDFDGVHFALDSAFGAASMLGVAWIASVAI